MGTVIRWLHLSDFHQGQPQQRWLWPAVRAKFLDDLARLHGRTGPWDLILFTGDLVNRGSEEEFAEFTSSIGCILQRVGELNGAIAPLLLAVPGNHDLVRPNVKEPEVKLLTRGPAEPESVEELFCPDASDYRRVVERSFKAYQDWWQQQPVVRQSSYHGGLLPGDFATTFEKDGARLGIVGLNSAAIQLAGGDFRGKLYLHPHQVHVACNGDAPAWMQQHHACLLLTHHPPSWLCPDAQQALRGEIAPAGAVCLHLFGHTHEGASETRSTGGRPPVREWQAYSLFGMEQPEDGKPIERRHGYCVGELRLEENQGFLRRWPRLAERSRDGNWDIHPDHREFRLEDDEATSPELFSLLQPIVGRRAVVPAPTSNARSTPPSDAPHVPTEAQRQEALAEFRNALSARLRYPHLASLESDETARLLTGVTLDEIYVVPTLYEERAFIAVEEETRALHVELDSPDVSSSRRREIRSRLAHLDHLRWTGHQEQTPPEPLTPDSALSRWQRWVILGTPGAGKSTLLQYLALRWTDDTNPQNGQQTPTAPLLPLLISVREYAFARRRIKDLALDKFLLGHHAGDNAVLAYALRECFVAGHAVILIDALDEVSTDGERQSVSKAITAFLDCYPKLRCIITTRPYGYQPLTGDLVHLRLPHFSEQEIEKFVRLRQFALERRRPKPDLGAALASAERIVAQVKKHASIKELARNPLLLLMTCDLCLRGQQLPVDRAQLYDRAIRTLLLRWNQWHSELQERGGRLATEGLTEDALFAAFGEVALRQQRSSQTRPVMTAARLQQWLRQTLVRSGMSPHSAKSMAHSYVQAAAGRAGLLDERGPRQFVFWHQTFQEYLAATALVRDPRKAALRLWSVADRPRWHEVLQLALAHIAKVQDRRGLANRLVRGLMTEHRPALDSATHQRLCLAASCLAQNPWISRSVADTILTSLSQSLAVIPVTPLAGAFEEAVRARAGLVPSEALTEALVDLCDLKFGYIGNTDVSKHAARIIANGTARSHVGLSFCEKNQKETTTTADEKNDAFSILSGDRVAVCQSAALGLLRAGRCTAPILIALTSVMREDRWFIRDVEHYLKAVRSRAEPILDAWLSGEGPSLDVPAAVLLSFLDRHDDGVIDVLCRELCRNGYPSSDLHQAFSLLHWHAKTNKAVRARLFTTIPTLSAFSNDQLLRLLLSLLRESDEVLRELVELLKQPNSQVERLLLLRGPLNESHDPHTTHRIREQLLPLLDAPDPWARYRATVLLESLDAPEKATAALLSCMQCDVPKIQIAAIAQLLGVQFHCLWNYAEAYFRTTLQIRPDVQANIATIVQCLRQLLQDKHVQHRVHAALLLVALRKDDDEAVVDVLSSADAIRIADRGEYRLHVFQQYPHHMMRLAQRMAAHLGSPDVVVRDAAQVWLTWYCHLAPIEILQGHLTSLDAAVRLCAAQVLLDAKQVDPTLQSILVDALSTLTGHQLRELSERIQRIGEPTREVVSRLAALLAERLEREAISDASKNEAEDQKFSLKMDVEYLLQLLMQWMRQHAWVAECVVDLLMDLMCRPQPERNVGPALSTLHKLLAAENKEHPDLVAKTIAAHLPGERDLVRLFLLAEKLYFFGRCRKQSQTALRRCLASTNLRVRFEAASRLGPRTGKPSSKIAKALVSCLSSTDAQLRMRVLVELTHHRAALDVVVPSLNSLLAVEERGVREHWFDFTFMDSDRETGVFLAQGEEQEESDQAAVDLERALRYLERRPHDDKEEPPMCVLAAGHLCALGQGPENNPQLKQTLLAWLAHPDPARKIRAMRYLQRSVSWAPDPATEVVLRSWLDGEDERLREAAARILFRRADTRGLVEDRLMDWLDTHRDDETDNTIRQRWMLYIGFVKQSDRLLRWLLHHYLCADRRDRVYRRFLWQVCAEQPERVASVIHAELPQLPLSEAAIAIQLLDEMKGMTRTAAALAVRIWAEADEGYSGIEHLIYKQGAGDREFQELLVPYLSDPAWWRRTGAAQWLLSWDYARQPLSQALQMGLTSEDPEIRYSACCRLQEIGLPKDRPAIATALHRLIADAPSVYATSDCLRPFRTWPEFAEVLDGIYAAELTDRSGLHWDDAVRHFRKRPQRADWLRNTLLEIARSGDSWEARQAFDCLRQMGAERRPLLEILLAWLADGHCEYACPALVDLGLLTKETAKGLRMHGRRHRGQSPDERMGDLLTLAQDPLVPSLFAEMIDSGVVPAVERCATGQLQPDDESVLAKAVRVQANDSVAQSFARCWLYYWLRERSKALLTKPPHSKAAPLPPLV